MAGLCQPYIDRSKFNRKRAIEAITKRETLLVTPARLSRETFAGSSGNWNTDLGLNASHIAFHQVGLFPADLWAQA